MQNLKNLEILALRDNRLSSLPEEIGTLAPTLRELHLQVIKFGLIKSAAVLAAVDFLMLPL